jgi:formylglycine-generating enzyme required for sulfatase activity
MIVAVSVMAVAAMLLAAGAVQATVVIVTVPVGNPGNAADTRPSWGAVGAVDYEFNIGKYEVTAGQYTTFLNAVAKTDTYCLYNTLMWSSNYGCKIQQDGTPGNYTYSVASDWANRPVNYVSWADAARFTNWLHNGQPTGAQGLTTTEDGDYYINGVPGVYSAENDALLNAVSREADWKWAIPSMDEWHKAAYYNPATETYYNYPTSSDSKPSNQLINPDPGNNANFRSTTIGAPYYRTEVGEFENSASPYGTFDQGGNVFEYTEGIGGPNLLHRISRSGSFGTWETRMLYDGTNVLNPSWGDSSRGEDGFRVVQVPEPATMALLALGGIGMLVRRKRSK